MSLPRIDVCDPTDEGPAISAALRARGLLVTEVAAADLGQGSDAAIVVLAAEAEGALAVLAALRAGATSVTPVVLLGAPRGTGELDRMGALALGADAWFARPVPVDRLARKVETFLAPADSRLRTAPVSEVEPPKSHIPPERTMRLAHDDSDVTGDVIADSIEPRPSSQIVPLSTGVHEVGSRPGDAAGAEGTSRGPRSALSPELRELLARAAARAFPDAPPVVVELDSGDEPPEVLVPRDVLDDAEDEMSALDALDALEASPSGTQAPVSVIVSSQAMSRTPGPPRESEAPPQTTSAGRRERRSVPARARGSARPVPAEEELPGDATAGGRGRAGSLGPAAGLGLLFRVGEKRLDARVTLEAGAGSVRLVLGVRHGDVRTVDGPVAERALERLGLVERVQGEEEALAALERRVAAGTITAFAKERAVSRAREELLGELVCGEGARFVIAPLDAAMLPTTSAGGSGPRPFRAALPAMLVEAARARLSLGFVQRTLGATALRFVPTRTAEDVFARCALAPELGALLSAREGATLDTLLAELAGEPGVPGLLYALVVAGALTATPVAPGKDLGVAASARLRREVQEAAGRAEEGDYFAILGLPRDAETTAVRLAHAERSRALASLPLEGLGLDELVPLRALALDALDEALAVLADDGLRARYAQAIV